MPNDIVITPGSKVITFQDGSNTQQRLMLTGSNLTFTGTLKAASFSGSLSGSIKNISGTTNYVPKFTSTSNLGNSIIYDDGTNIGIGTSTLYAKLVVSKGSGENVEFNPGNSTWNGTLIESINRTSPTTRPDLNLYTGATSNGSVKIITNNTEKMRVNYDGNIGIGTSSPAAKLEVSSGEVRISSAAAYITHLNYLNAGSNYITTANDGATIFRGSSNNVTVMTVLGGGNVGIGTSSPIAKLHITGSATVPAALFMGNIGVGTTSLIYPVSNRALIEMYGPSDAICALRNSNGNSYIQKYSTDFYLVNNDTGFISIQTNLSERVRIKSDGNVGIGTTSPECILDVVGATGKTYSSTNAGTLVLRDTANATTNVGGAILFKGYKTSNSAVAHFVAIDGVKENSTAGDESGTFRIHTANSSGTFSEKLRVTSGGNVGIGTTSPATKLDLKGNLFVANAANGNNTIAFGNIGTLGPLNGAPNNLTGSAFLVVSSSTASGAPSHMKFYTTSGGTCSERLRIAADGNVGIGTTSPAYKLDVSGDIKASSATLNINGNLNSLNGNLTTMGYNLTGSPNNTTGWVTVYTSKNNLWSGDIVSQIAYDTYNTAKLYTRYSADGGSTWSSWKTVINSDALSGTSNYVTKFTGTNTVGNSIIYDTGTYVNIGTTSTLNSSRVSIVDINAKTSGANCLTFGTTTGGANDFQLIISRGSNTAGYYAFDAVEQSVAYKNIVFNQSGGNVGIGTTSPTQKLSVVSGSALLASTAVAGELYFGKDSSLIYLKRDNTYDLSLVQGGDSNSGLYLAGAGNVYLSIDSNNNDTDKAFIVQNNAIKSGTELFRVQENGNVGIGVSSPSQLLHVYKGNNGGLGGAIMIDNNGNAVGNETALMFGDGGSSYIRAAISSTTEGSPFYGDIKFKTGISAYSSLTTRMIILGNGNVGIGTTDPLTKLDVRSGRITAGTVTSTLGSTIIAGYYGDGNLTVLGSEYSSGGPMLGYGVTPSTSSTAAFLSSTGINIGRTAYTQDGATHRWYIGATQTVAIGSSVTASEVMRINIDGNLGIGTSSPAYKLEVSGNFAARNSLTVSGGTNQHTYLVVNRTNYEAGIQLQTSSTTKWWMYMPSGDDSSVRFYTSQNSTGDILTITNTGNVGIGTTSPKNKLHVAGLMTLDSTIIYSKVNTVTTNNPIRITIPFTKAGAGADFIVKVKAIAMADNASGVNYLDYVGYSGYTYNFNTNLTTVEKVGNVVVNSYVSASSSTAGNLYIELNGDDGYLQDSNWTIQTDVFGNSRYSTFDSGSITTFATSISEDSLQTSFNKVFGGNVGVGTTSPDIFARGYGKVLGISGSSAAIEINSKTGQGAYFDMGVSGTRIGSILASSTAFEVGTIGANPLHLYTNNSYKLSIISDGNVGIGTTSPNAKLDLEGSGEIYFDLNSTTNASKEIRFQNNGSTVGYVWQTGATMGFGQGSTYNSLFLANGGSVGIGTNSPASKLHVSGSIRAAGGSDSKFVSIVSSGTDRYFLDCYGTSNRQIFALYENSSNVYLNSWSTMAFRANQNGGSGGSFWFSGGNVGIGTTNPTARLTISGSGTGLALIGNAGFASSGNYTGISLNGTLSTTSYNFLSSPTDSTNLYINRPAAGNIYFRNNNNDQMVLTTGGNLGIGTTSPDSKLRVEGNGYFNGILSAGNGGVDTGISLYFGAGSTDYGRIRGYEGGSNSSAIHFFPTIWQGASFINSSAGAINITSTNGVTFGAWNNVDVAFAAAGNNYFKSNVGIGTSSPTRTLHVSGSFRVQGAVYDGNNSAGTSGSVLHTTGTKTVWKTLPGGGSTNIWISAGEMIPRSFSGSGVNSVELTGSARPNYDVLEFDAGIAEYAQVIRVLPNNWSGTSTVTGKFYWTATGGSGAVVWGLRGRCYSDDNPINSAGTLGTGQTATDTLLKAYDMHISPATSAITISGSLANGKPIIFEVYRDATNGSDTLAVDAQLLGVEITYS